MLSKLAALCAILGAVRAQQVCTLTPENHPPLTWSKCASGGSCSTVSGSVTVDANWRWTHTTSGTTNCYDGNTWSASLCPDGKTCAANCCLDGADYQGTYGVTTTGNALNLKFVTQGPYSKNIGSRLYLMESDTKYQMFNLLNNEFTFDVDVSNIGCGLNGALYFVSMDADGGLSKYSGNKAGAKYGTGYCDSQCPSDVKFINGVANSDGWEPSPNDSNAGTGGTGSCCAEMDIWEANKISAAYTPHPCSNNAQHTCSGDSCGGTYSNDRYAGTCDPDGCDFNSWRQGNHTFYGPGSGFTVDTNQKMTVVTQFLTGSDGKLNDIKRFYVQNGRVIPNSESSIAGVTGNSITTQYCTAQKAAFGDNPAFFNKGGLAQMGEALRNGMVLVMSLWDDHAVNMLWLDSNYPTDSTAPGASRGSCPITSGVPAEVEAQVPNSNVIFSNIKFGPIGSTFNQPPPVGSSSSSSVRTSTTSSVRSSSSSSSIRTTSTLITSSTRTSTTSSSVPTAVAQRWGQCGGIGWNGPTVCASPWTCQKQNDWYSQCL